MGQGVQRFKIQRISDGDGQGKPVVFDGDHPVAFRVLVGNRLGDPGIKGQLGEAHELDAGIGGKSLRHSFLGEMRLSEEVLDNGFRPGKRVPGSVDIIRAHHAGFGEQLREVIFVGKHWVWSP